MHLCSIPAPLAPAMPWPSGHGREVEMARSLTNPFLAAALVLAALPLVASAATGAERAALDAPTTSLLDSFNRPNENPLSGGGNWTKADASSTAIQLANNRVSLAAGGVARYQWTPATSDGDVEVWATYAGAGMDDGAAAELVIVTDVDGSNQLDGYALRAFNTFGGSGWQIRRLANWSATVIASAPFGPGGIPSSGQLILFRRAGDTLEGWRSLDGGASWTREITASDPTYTTNLRIGLGFSIALASSPAWDNFGGGAMDTPPPPPAGPPPGQSNGTICGRGSIAITASCTFADPVNSLTGAFVTQIEDLATPGTGVPFAWTRSYTSSDATVGSMGPGWTHTYAATLLVQPDGDVLARGEEGQEVSFARQPDGSFDGAPGARATLTSIAGGYELVRTDQVIYRFDAGGRLLSIEDRNGQGVTLAYDAHGRLQTINDASGSPTTVTYDASNLVSAVSTQDGRSVSYGYNSGRLTSVTDVRGKVWTYGYDADGRLATVRDPLGHIQVANAYGAEGRVQSQTDALGKTTTFAWDAATQVATATDANGKLWRHDYDEDVLAKEIDPLGNVTQVGRDPDLNETAITGPTGERTTMAYGVSGNLLAATAPASLGSVRKTFDYNGRNDPVLVTDARGKVTAYTYDTQGNVASVTQDGTRVAAYTYDGAGRVPTSADGNGKTTSYTYDGSGDLDSLTDPLGNETTYTYDGAGRVLTRVDPKGNCAGCTPADFTWTYSYDPAGRQLTETDPLGHTTTNAYDDAGRLTSSTDANNHTTSYTYDDANRILRETAPDPDGLGPQVAPVTSYGFDAVGNKVTETDPRGNTTSFAYDAANRLTRETGTDPDGAGPQAPPVTTYVYDPDGNLASLVEPRGNAPGTNPDDFRTRHTYDAAGRLLTTTDALGSVTTNVYDPVGNLASVRDAKTHATSHTYDSGGRLLTVTAPDGGLTRYAYDDAGNLLTRTDANDHTTTFAYDDAGRLLSETGPDPNGGGSPTSAVTSYTYDTNGNRLTLTDPNGNATLTAGDGQTSYGYDRANRLVAIDYSDQTPDVSFTYDAVGNRLTMTDGAGTETRTYDALDRLLTVTRGSNTFSYQYDATSNVTRRASPGNILADYAFDALNRLGSVSSGGQQTSYAYDVASNLTRTTLPAGNGYVETRAYDRAGHLTEVQAQKGATVLARFRSTLDPIGNPTEIARTGSLAQTQTYTYDESGRLLSVCFEEGSCAAGSDPFIRWTYDRVGNRLTEQRPAGRTSYAYDGRDRLLSAGQTSYTYDQNGNELAAGPRTFTYDLANRLETTTLGNTTETYLYDGDGVRVRASTGQQARRETNFLWDVNHGLPQLARETNGSGTLLRQYLYGARRISQTAGSATSYFVHDGLGSVASVTSASGATQWTFSHEPFGSLRTEQEAPGNQPDVFVRFTGEYLDQTGLYHLRARQYDPQAGRFLRPDPAGQSPNESAISAYVYGANRPTVLVDPSGETFEAPDTGLVSAEFAASFVDWQSPAVSCQSPQCGRRVPQPPVACAARAGHPLAKVGVFLGGPYAGTHTRGNWQSDRAVDIGVPLGTRVCAIFGGMIGPRVGSLDSSEPALAGLRLTIVGARDEAYYAHLSRIVVRPRQRVVKDQVLGFSGKAGVPHLHIALKRGSPRRFCDADRIGGRC
jgi:RHS repeat-associated protein